MSELQVIDSFAEATFAAQKTLTDVFNATEKVIVAERVLGKTKVGFLSEVVDGANEAQRKASLEQLLEAESDALAEAEKELRLARYRHELNTLELDIYRQRSLKASRL